MRRHLLLVLITAGLVLFGGVGCSDDGDDEVQTATTQRDDPNGGGDTTPEDTKPESGADDEVLCEALEPLSESNKEVAEIGSFDERRDYLIDNIPNLNDAYDEAIEIADGDDMKANLEALREYNDEFLELLEENDTEAELSSALAATDTSDVEQAGVELNDFTTDECGFAVSG